MYSVFLHGGEHGSELGWSLYPSILIGFSVWTVLYWWANRGKDTPLSQQIAFHIGTLVGLLALISPLDELGDEYLFSAHMVQHLLLMFVAAPLWLIGTPGWLIDGIFPKSWDTVVKRLASPMSAFAAFVGILWLWHIPALYELAQESEAIHAFEHLCFMGAAVIGWWPVMGAETSRIPKPAPPVRILYIFLLTIPCSALAAILTFAKTPLYPFYSAAPRLYGLTTLQDQQLGGLLMWLPTHMFLLLTLGITFFKWFTTPNQETRQDFANNILRS